MPASARVNDVHNALGISSQAEENSLHFSRLRQAIEDSGVQFKVVASSLGVSPSYLSDMLKGEKPFKGNVEYALPPAVARIYKRLRAEDEGWDVTSPDERYAVIAQGISVLGRCMTILRDELAKLPARTSRQMKASIDR